MLSCTCLGECWDFVALSLEKWAFLGGVCCLSGGTVRRTQHSAKGVGRTFFFFPNLLSYRKEKSSLLYERLLNRRCLNVRYNFCLF